MKKFLKYTGMFLLIVVLGAGVYCGCVVLKAENYTRNVIVADITKAQWRHPNGPAEKFEISINDLSKRQIEIMIKVQDPGFYHHNGIDLSTPGAGLTTITQAITKKLYFENFKPGFEKLKQSLVAWFVVDKMVSKDDQLNLFINLMYFGSVDGKPVVGLESAAKTYYGQTVSKLSEEQYISLIAMLVAPDTFHIINHPAWNTDRTNRIRDLISGKYKPKGLMDQFYGELPKDVVKAGLPPASYWGKPSDTKGL